MAIEHVLWPYNMFQLHRVWAANYLGKAGDVGGTQTSNCQDTEGNILATTL